MVFVNYFERGKNCFNVGFVVNCKSAKTDDSSGCLLLLCSFSLFEIMDSDLSVFFNAVRFLS